MQYLLLIYENESTSAAMSPEQRSAFTQDYVDFTRAIKATGQFKAGDALQPVSKATTVRVRDGKTLTTDGPFAETREQLGGYYLVDAADLDEALALAARIPSARHGSIEVRPIRVYPTT
ncbi:MAG TPA: YciI family protein [Kofleriaceae bacterium]|nr:YciI family protein [Kofleriaceae bacterium]